MSTIDTIEETQEQEKETVIHVEHVNKVYKLYDKPKDRVKETLHPFRKKYHTDFYALRDISMEIKHGDTVGIVGLNGSGKSTLLKIICGVLTPSAGNIAVRGNISALLELGAGFNPDFTGIENIYFQGSIMGLAPKEMKKLMPSILDFADIGDFVYQPVKTYSSGMFVRLAFAIAIMVDPDILVVDEALAVGDAYFQAKCMTRIRQFKETGKTLFFVSHDPSAVKALCDMAYLLDHGKIVEHGTPDMVFDVYNSMLNSGQTDAKKGKGLEKKAHADTGKVQVSSGSGELGVKHVELRNSRGQAVEHVQVGEQVTLHFDVVAQEDVPQFVFGYIIKNRLGQMMYGTNTWHSEQIQKNVAAGTRYHIAVEFVANLGEGDYSISTALTSTETHMEKNYEWRDLVCIFKVYNSDKQYFIGNVWLPPTFKITEER